MVEMSYVSDRLLDECTPDTVAQILESRAARESREGLVVTGICLALTACMVVPQLNRGIHAIAFSSLQAAKTTATAVDNGINYWAPNLNKPPKLGDKINGYEVTSEYGDRVHPVTGEHRLHAGVDLATPVGTSVYAIGRKLGDKVFLRCWNDPGGGGLVATMESPSFPGYKFQALHLSRCAAPTDGKAIEAKAGQIVAATGSSGMSTGPHGHFEVHQNGNKIAPAAGFAWLAMSGEVPQPSVSR
jgi:murein DD-endopeptidase MepM/ murein hydrolase activator NlpD